MVFLGCNTPTPLLSEFMAQVDDTIVEAVCRHGTGGGHVEWSPHLRKFATMKIQVPQFPAQKCRSIKKSFARDRFAQSDGARLPYSTLPGVLQVCITRKGNPAPRLPTKRARENHLFSFSAIARAKLIGAEQITPTLRGLASSWDSILNTSTRCYTTTRCNIEPASNRRPRHQWRHKTLQRHKRRQSSRFRAAGKQTAAKRMAPRQAREPGTTTLYRFASGTSTAHRPSLRPTLLRPMLQRIGYCTEMG